MRDIPVGWRARLRELSLGPIPWGLWTWTHQDGSTWAALALEGEEILGWAAVSAETDVLPVVAAYVSEVHRGRGLAELLVSSLLRWLVSEGHLARGGTVFASLERWPKYVELGESCGITVKLWQ